MTKTRLKVAWNILLLASALSGRSAIADCTAPRCDPLRQTYQQRRCVLRDQYRSKMDAIRCRHRSACQALDQARRVALDMCEPQRSCELERIRRERKRVNATFRYDLASCRQALRVEMQRLDAWYELASRRARLSNRVCRIDHGEAVFPGYPVPPVLPGAIHPDAHSGQGWNMLDGEFNDAWPLPAEVPSVLDGPVFPAPPTANGNTSGADRQRSRNIVRFQNGTTPDIIGSLVKRYLVNAIR